MLRSIESYYSNSVSFLWTKCTWENGTLRDDCFKLHNSNTVSASCNRDFYKSRLFPLQPSGPMCLNEVHCRLTFMLLKNRSSSVNCTRLMNFSKHEVPKNTNSCLRFLYTAMLFCFGNLRCSVYSNYRRWLFIILLSGAEVKENMITNSMNSFDVVMNVRLDLPERKHIWPIFRTLFVFYFGTFTHRRNISHKQ